MATMGLTTLTDPNHTFSFEVGGRTIERPRDIEVRVFAPEEPGTYPVVFYSHGHLAAPSGAGSLNAQALADAGYIVILPTHLDSADQPAFIRDDFPFGSDATLHRIADMSFLVDQVDAIMTVLPGYAADMQSPVIAGHSHGARVAELMTGVTTIDPILSGLAPDNPYGLDALYDPRFAASILLSPAGIDNGTSSGFTATSWEAHAVPTLSITGTLDVSSLEPDPAARLDGFTLSSAPGQHAVVIRDATHLDIGGFSEVAEISDAVVDAAVLFLDAYVKGDAAALADLSDPDTLTADNPLYVAVFDRDSDRGRVSGTDEDDSLVGSITDDLVHGGGGNDLLSGGSGVDMLFGGSGNDRLDGGNSADELFGEDGDDWISGGGNFDHVDGGNGHDVLAGDAGNDILDGGAGNDTVSGGTGSDRLFGGDDDDVLDGGSGADSLAGGTGFDVLIGGTGNDTFDFSGAFGVAIVSDFRDDHIEDDRLQFSRQDFADFSAIKSAMHQVGDDVVISTGMARTVVIENVTVGSLDAHDFLLV